MDDLRKRAIQGIECWIEWSLNSNDFDLKKCADCPYNKGFHCLTLVMKDALELIKREEPRVMAIKELEETGEPVFIELKTNGADEEVMTCFGLLSEWDDLAFHFIVDQWLLDGKPFFRIYGCELKRKEYNIQWRPWNKLTTIKQMKAVKWDDGGETKGNRSAEKPD